MGFQVLLHCDLEVMKRTGLFNSFAALAKSDDEGHDKVLRCDVIDVLDALKCHHDFLIEDSTMLQMKPASPQPCYCGTIGSIPR